MHKPDTIVLLIYWYDFQMTITAKPIPVVKSLEIRQQKDYVRNFNTSFVEKRNIKNQLIQIIEQTKILMI